MIRNPITFLKPETLIKNPCAFRHRGFLLHRKVGLCNKKPFGQDRTEAIGNNVAEATRRAHINIVETFCAFFTSNEQERRDAGGE